MNRITWKMLGLSAIVGLGCAGLAMAGEPIELTDDSSHGGALETRNAPIHVGDRVRVDGAIHSRNGSIRLGRDGRFHDVSSRNGSILVGDGSQTGALEARNGPIDLGQQGRADRIETRNGSITLGAGSQVSGKVETRNGSVSAAAQARVDGNVITRNGRVELGSGCHVGGRVETRNGAIELEAAVVDRGLYSKTGELVLRQASEVGADVVIEIEQSESGWRLFGSRSDYADAGHIRILEGSVVVGNVIVRLPADYNGAIPSVTVDASSTVRGRLLVDERVELNLQGNILGPVERH